MTRGIKHHAKRRLVAIGGLVRGNATTRLDDPRLGRVQIIRSDLEVHHLRLSSRRLGPMRRLVPLLCLE